MGRGKVQVGVVGERRGKGDSPPLLLVLALALALCITLPPADTAADGDLTPSPLLRWFADAAAGFTCCPRKA